jgi:tRNA A-37 threonylcarbamoyl transferase component Bud32
MALHCPNCGEELTKQTRFCNKCGANLVEVFEQDATVVTDQAEASDEDSIDEVTIASEPGPTQVMSEGEATDDELTRAASTPKALEDDGQTIARSEAPDTVDAGQTKAMPEAGVIDEGQTKAMPDVPEKQPARKITATAIADLKPGRILQERYRLDQILGKGGFGAAYLAEDIKLKRGCVVKQMLAPKGVSPQELEIHQANFEREASLLVQLNHPGHPNIPEIYDYFSDASGNYLVMKYIEGQSLKEVLDKDEGGIPWREALRYIIDVCSALNYMHTLGDEPVMHRDVKPANIVLGDDGRVWLLDFGLAKSRPVESTGDLMATRAAGSLGYAPLEQWLGEATPASDVYALGATLHHLVTGLSPSKAFRGEFNVQKLKEMHGQFTPVRKIDKSLPKELDLIIPRATDPDPDQRLTPQQFQQELEALVSGTQAAALYTFKNGESAKTVQDLVILCEKNRQEAQAYLYHGDFERWFLLLNRNDLAEAATQAVKQGKNQKDGLERFLKLILPNLFLNRMSRATGRLTRLAILFVLTLIVVVVLLAIGGSYLGGWFMQRSITSSEWNFNKLELDAPNSFTETQINDGIQSITGAYFDEFNIDLRPPNLIDVEASWGGLSFNLPVTLQLKNGKPYFDLTGINGIPLPLVADNISQGINSGVDDVFQKAPVDISELTVDESEVVFMVEPSGRAPLPTPTPIITPTPTPGPTPTITPTPVGMALVAIFNELDKDIILEIEGEVWEIAANDTKVIEKKPGTYNFIVRYRTTGSIAVEGTKTWTASSYKWRIGGEE